jgi:hypothetical protein
MIKKSLIFAVLATFCLTMVLFTVIPVGSYGTYDPWIDFNDDGKIDAKDVAQVASNYGSKGDPTKNVSVTNWPQTYSLQTGIVTLSSSGYNADDLTIACGGFSRLSIMLGGITFANIGAGNNVTISFIWLFWRDKPRSQSMYVVCDPVCDSKSILNETIFDGTNMHDNPHSYVFETKAPYCELVLGYDLPSGLPTGWWVTFYYAVYLRNE